MQTFIKRPDKWRAIQIEQDFVDECIQYVAGKPVDCMVQFKSMHGTIFIKPSIWRDAKFMMLERSGGHATPDVGDWLVWKIEDSVQDVTTHPNVYSNFMFRRTFIEDK